MKNRIDELAQLMDDYKLSEAELCTEGFTIAYKKRAKSVPAPSAAVVSAETTPEEVGEEESESIATVDAAPAGVPITSPMTGIYYSAPSPGSPPFVQVGDEITAGQVIGLIEAMKVFNEVPSPTSGTVSRTVVESGQLVNLGDPLLYIG